MKNKILSLVFIIYVFTFALLGVLFKDEKISLSERRTLSSFPEYKMDGEYVTKLEKYLLEQFPYRDNFRAIKAGFNYNILHTLENNGIYIKDNYIFKSQYPTNLKSIENFKKVINNHRKHLSEENNVYILIVPDKNFYLDSKYFLQIDYSYIYKELDTLDIQLIDIRDLMELEDYYETDIHWRQEKLDKVIKRMDDIMNFNYKEQQYEKHFYNDFYGGYYGESAIGRKPEQIVYLTNDVLDNVNVRYLENINLHSVYNIEKLKGMDGYDVYLDGASAFIEIENENSLTDKELVIFRDSFGSSIAPLLIPYYKKITLIDVRYMYSQSYLQLIDFTDQDVLFLYNTIIVNSSFALRS